MADLREVKAACKQQRQAREKRKKMLVAAQGEKAACGWSWEEFTDCCSKCQYFIRSEEARENNGIATILGVKDLRISTKSLQTTLNKLSKT